MGINWPQGFERTPDESWTIAPLDPAGLNYDAMSSHLWYSNLNLTVSQLAEVLIPGQFVVDYSGGTGILARRLVEAIPEVGILIVDSSARFLRVALENFRGKSNVAFRLLHYVKDEHRLERLDEITSANLLDVDAIVSTNAVHLYPNLSETFTSWAKTIRHRGKVFVQSGDIRNPDGKPNEWLISEVVAQVRSIAKELIFSESRFKQYREVFDDSARIEAYEMQWKKIFPPIRSLGVYTDSLIESGFVIRSSTARTIQVGVLEWYDAMQSYPDLLPWIGGSPAIDKRDPSASELKDRLDLLKGAFMKLFPLRQTFDGTWTYIVAEHLK